MKSWTACLAWLALAGTSIAAAEQRALIVGVGKYVTPGIDLPGIDLDVERMHETLNRLGFSDAQIHTLTDEQATSTRVISELDGWLRQGVKPEDRVVFYYSGHGSRVPDWNGDESDGADDVLVTHDMQRARRNGRATLAGVVVDDSVGELLAKNPSRHILMMVDACHSGTVSRSFRVENRSLTSEPVYRKSFEYAGMPSESSPLATRGVSAGSSRAAANYVLLAAAGDHESAIGTSRGGMFTIAVTEAIAGAAANGQSISVTQLRDAAAQYIRSKVDKDQLYTPQVSGDPAQADAPLTIAAAGPDGGPNRRKLLALVASQSHTLELKPSAPRYRVGDAVRFSMNVPASGYLNVVAVDAKDQATVLFPNHLQEGNAVSAGLFQFPTSQMAFDLQAAEPLGPTLVVAFLSSEPIDFYRETLDNRDEHGNITADFATLSHSATRAIRVTPRRNETYAGQVEIQTDR